METASVTDVAEAAYEVGTCLVVKMVFGSARLHIKDGQALDVPLVINEG